MNKNRLQYAKEKLEERLPLLGTLADEIQKEIDSLPGEEQEWMIYLMATLPFSDLANYPLSTWAPYIRHALNMRSSMEWCRQLPEDIFADCVLYPRINTEDIAECRRLFAQLLMPRVSGLTAKEAALEVNYWCQENATYQSADDRTASALTVYRSGSGRCGEESTFTVTALRSVGIAARQVYAPWWSHCDDNHAWVEVYIDGEWHFMGACEPEPILDKGWFNSASSRAMMVHTRTFTGAITQEDLIALYGAEKAARCHLEGGVTYENITQRYAHTAEFNLQVLTPEGKPAAGALVQFEILNMAEFMPIASMTTPESGSLSLRLGLGQVRIHVNWGTLTVTKMQVLKDDTELILFLQEAPQEENEWEAFDFTAPTDAVLYPGTLTEEQRMARDERIDKGTLMREERIRNFYQEDEAAKYSSDMQKILHLAGGNFEELASFLKESALGDGAWREALLKGLTAKDYRDAPKAVLNDHILYAAEYAAEYALDIWEAYVLQPRVAFETLTPYRSAIDRYFNDKTKKEFAKKPQHIWQWITENLRMDPKRDYAGLFYTPGASLTSGHTDPTGAKILFVAICRTLGVAARLNPVSGAPEYLKGDRFVRPDQPKEKKKIAIEFLYEDADEWIYRQTFTLARQNGGAYERVELPHPQEAEGFTCYLEPGRYRLITVNRLPNGHMYAYQYFFTAEENGLRSITLRKRPADLLETLSHNAIADFFLRTEDGCKKKASELLTAERTILMWLEEGKEPTEHILNEMLEQVPELAALGADIVFVLRSKEAAGQKTLAATLKALPQIRILYDDFRENVQVIGRRMYVDPDKLPLVVLLQGRLCGVYASSGYNVGLADIVIRIMKAIGD